MPLHIIDIFDVARKEGQLEGDISLRSMPALGAMLSSDQGDVHYAVEGLGVIRGLPAVRLRVDTNVTLSCARCQEPIVCPITRDVTFLLVKSEADADMIPVDEDDDNEDIIVGSQSFSLIDWVQEEVILSLPAFPSHGDCAPATIQEDESELEKPNPFAALAALKH